MKFTKKLVPGSLLEKNKKPEYFPWYTRKKREILKKINQVHSHGRDNLVVVTVPMNPSLGGEWYTMNRSVDQICTSLTTHWHVTDHWCIKVYQTAYNLFISIQYRAHTIHHHNYDYFVTNRTLWFSALYTAYENEGPYICIYSMCECMCLVICRIFYDYTL